MKFNLSEITNVIKERRTIYPEQYSDRKIHKEIVVDVLNNAIWAPNHGMTQPWRFKVFMAEESRKKLSNFLSNLYTEKTTKENFNEMKFKKLKNRPLKSSVIIAVLMERDKKEKIREIEEIEAVSCAIQNMYLTCTAYGIGGFWATPNLIYTNEMNAFFNLGEKDKCLGLFYMGYPAIEWPKGQRRPIEYVTEWVEENE